jgi:hypothetical protein
MPSIERIVPILRQQGQPVPGLIQLGSWIDACLLVAGVAFTYAVPTRRKYYQRYVFGNASH